MRCLNRLYRCRTGSRVSSPDTIRDLLTSASSGDRTAFAELYRITVPRLYGVALRILRREELATAVLRDHFVALWSDAGQVAEMHDPLAVMVARVRTSALDTVRDLPESGLSLEPFEVDGEVEDPLARPERSPDLELLLACLGRLPEERRRMVLHAYYDGWSRDSLSLYCDAPSHAVNTWMWRSIGELDLCLSP